MRDRLEELRRRLPRAALPFFLCLLALLALGSARWTAPYATPLLLLGLGGGWWWLKNRRAGRTESRRLRCMESLSLRPGSSLHLVVVDGKKLLIGCSERQMALLGRLEPEGDDQ